MNSNTISTTQIADHSAIQKLFEMFVSKDDLDKYRLPVSDNRARVIVGLSGGADSTVLALFAAVYLLPRYPNVEFLFTDTKAEPESCYETLDKLESLLGISIVRITPNKGLFERIDDYNGFLPNTNARWCTRELKIDPLKTYIDSKPNEYGFVALAGIRYDEADREGVSFQYSMENDGAAFPFVDLKITKEAVFSILGASIGIPSTYAYRSRSGCFNCFFQRNAELLGMLTNDPKAYARTEKMEKLTPQDALRWDSMPVTFSSLGIQAAYPVPSFIDVRKSDKTPEKLPAKQKQKVDDATQDMFATDRAPVEDELFAAFALYVDDHLSGYGGGHFTPGVYWQEFITLSTTMAGIKSALGTYYKFKKTTPMPQYDLKDLRIVIAQIRFPAGTIDTASPSKDSFTWKSQVALKQLRHLALNCHQALESTDLERRYSDAVSVMRMAGNIDDAKDAAELVIAIRDQLTRSPKSAGKVVWEGIYLPPVDIQKTVQLQLEGVSVDSIIKPAREDLEFDEVPRACIACSI